MIKKKILKKLPIKICSFCHQPEDKKWIETSAGTQKLYYFCCQRQSSGKDINFQFHRYSREPTAFGFDKATGKAWALDKKGRRFDPAETRYAQYPNDPRGWMATGKIKPKKIYHI